MEHRGGSFQTNFAVLLGFLATIWTIGAAASADGPSHLPRRVISVRILADPALRKNDAWKVDILRAVGDVSLALKEASGVALRIKAYDYWASKPIGVDPGADQRPRTVAEVLILMNRHIRDAGRGGAEIIIGLLAEGPEGPVFPGIADYLNGTVVVKYLKSKGGIPFVLLHEILHIYGAIDLKTKGSVMSLQNPGFRIDGFTKSILRANRLRSFLTGVFPLSEDCVPEAICLYESRRTLDLGEEELAICLGKLREARLGKAPLTH